MRRASYTLVAAIILIAGCAVGWAQSMSVGSPIAVMGTNGGQREHAIAYNHEMNEYLVVYLDAKTGWAVPGISAHLLHGDGTKKGSEISIRGPDVGAGSPCVAYNSVDDRYLVTFCDWYGDLWGQRVNANGTLDGGNFAIDASAALEPNLCYSPDTNTFLLAWRDDRVPGNMDCYCKLLGGNGVPVGPVSNLTDFTAGMAGNPQIAYDSDLDQFIVIIQNAETDYADLFARLVDASTGALGSYTRITDTDSVTEHEPGIAYDPDNHRYLLTYSRQQSQDVAGQFLAPDATPIGAPFSVCSPELCGMSQVAYHPRAKEFVVTMADWRDSSNWARRVSANGQAVGLPQRTNGSVLGFGNWNPLPVPNVSSASHDYLVCWQNNHTDVWVNRLTLSNYVTSPNPNGAYSAGQNIDIEVKFDRSVFVTGSPHLQLVTGATNRDAVYLSGSGGPTLTFRYTVQEGDSSSDLDYIAPLAHQVSAIFPNGGTMKDAGGADADLTLPSPGAVCSLGWAKDIVIDTQSATVTNITSDKANGTYKNGQSIYVRVTFSDVVYVTGSPRLELETGAVDRLASYSGGSTTQTLTFLYVVQNGDVSPDLDVTGINALLLNGGTIKDVANNPANLIVSQPGAIGSLGYNKNLVIDAERPVVANVTSLKPNGVYKAGELISVNVRFHEPVVVTGTPQLELETGAVDRRADYSSGSGTDTLVFAYTVQPDDATADLDYKSTASLLLSGGTIRDVPGNLATLTLPVPGAAGSLGANRELVIVSADGSISSAKQQALGSTVTLGDKVLYLKQGLFGYIEEPDRTNGIRVEGSFGAGEDSLVCLRGSLRESPGGELYVEADFVTQHGTGSVSPIGANNRFLGSGLAHGLFVTAWGRVLADPVGNTYFISDGSDAVGIKVIVDGAPGVSAGDHVIVRGAAGSDGARVIYGR